MSNRCSLATLAIRTSTSIPTTTPPEYPCKRSEYPGRHAEGKHDSQKTSIVVLLAAAALRAHFVRAVLVPSTGTDGLFFCIRFHLYQMWLARMSIAGALHIPKYHGGTKVPITQRTNNTTEYGVVIPTSVSHREHCTPLPSSADGTLHDLVSPVLIYTWSDSLHTLHATPDSANGMQPART